MQSHVKGPRPTTTTTTSTPTEQLPSVSWEKILVIEDFFLQEKSAGAASVLHVTSLQRCTDIDPFLIIHVHITVLAFLSFFIMCR